MKNNTVDVMIYIHQQDKPVSDSGVIATLEQLAGVIKAGISPIVEKLLVVKYDPQSISAQGVLNAVKQNGYQGALVGM